MPIKIYKPTTAARRNSSVNAFAELTKWEPEKSLIERRKKTGGRNHTGWITCRHIAGGNKQFYRRLDFKRGKDGIKATVEAIEYDPNGSGLIPLLKQADAGTQYISVPQNL